MTDILPHQADADLHVQVAIVTAVLLIYRHEFYMKHVIVPNPDTW